MNKITLLGGAGYIGSNLVLNKKLKKNNLTIIDRFYFGSEFLEKNINLIKKDIRNVKSKDFVNQNIVIDLASLSNDPTSDLDKKLTFDINYLGRVNCAKKAKKAGVNKYIFMSSCSVYGKNSEFNLSEKSKTDPVSEYARTCLLAEKEILTLSDNSFQVTSLRNSTVYGSSNRMRFDLVVNLMTATSFYENKIYIMGGGNQNRPLININDICGYILEIIECKTKKYSGEIFNIGYKNYSINQIANIVKSAITNEVRIIKTPDDSDKRNYHINFSKAKKYFKHKPKIEIYNSVKEIYKLLTNGKIIKNKKTSTIEWYKYLIDSKKIVDAVSIDNKIF
jgi:nucleoside-diphosphate-sugar epimerase